MLFSSIIRRSLFTLWGLSSATLLPKRDIFSGVTLYAYGEEANGAPVFYHDGLAYIGSSPSANWTGTTANVTISGDSSSITNSWSITANSTTTTFNSTILLYIIPTSGSFSQVGFAAAANIPTGGVSTGFAWFGTSVAYAANNSDYELQFSAVPSDNSGVWGLYWNAGGTTLNGTFAITLKSTPPTFPPS